MLRSKPGWLQRSLCAVLLVLLPCLGLAQDLCGFNAAGKTVKQQPAPTNANPIPGWGGLGGTGLDQRPLLPARQSAQTEPEGWGGLGGTGVTRSAPLAGTVMLASGGVTARQGALPARKLVRGDAVCEGDVISTAKQRGMLQIRLADQGMVMLYADTTLQIERFNLPAQIDGSERLALNLQQGGMRAMTGEIGHLHKENYLIKTPVAQIHIRGTDHEIYHVPQSSGRFASVPAGTYNHVLQGGTTLSNAHGDVRLEPSQSGFASLTEDAPAVVDALPAELRKLPASLRFKVTQDGETSSETLSDLPEVISSNGIPLNLDSETVSAPDQSAYVGVTTAGGRQQVTGLDGNQDDMNQLELDPDSGLPRAVYLADGTLVFYATEDTYQIEAYQDTVDGVKVAWGVYGGGGTANADDDWQDVDFHQYALSLGGATPLSVLEHPTGPINVSYSTIVGASTPTSEGGVIGGQLNSLSVGLQLGANPTVTSYALDVSDGNQRNWTAASTGSVSLADFKAGRLQLSGSCSSANCGGSVASGQASGVVIGTNGKGLITGYGLQTSQGDAVSGVAVLKRP